ncbi:hypothetical protein GCM10027051_21650 [Niabella terrae]
MMNKKRCGPPKFVFALCAIAAILLFGGVVMWLWNAILPSAFNQVNPISYWQGVGLLVLSKILFSGFRGPGGGRGKFGRARNLREKYKSMTEEEKQQFKEAIRQRCRMRS